MKPETILRKLRKQKKDWLSRIAHQIYVAAWCEASHATWSECERCKKIKANAIASIRTVRRLRFVD